MKKIRCTFGWLIPILALGLFLITPFTGFAATTPHMIQTAPTYSSSSDFYALQKTCAVIDVYLHGTQNATNICDQAKAFSGISPHTEVRPCNAPGITMIVYYNQFQNAVCFIKTGYWGYRINNVDEVQSPTRTNGWILWYLHGGFNGTSYNLNKYNDWLVDFTVQEVDITQIYPGGQHT